MLELLYPVYGKFSTIPNQFAPIGGNDTIPKGFGNHTAMTLVGTQDVARAAQRPEITHFVGGQFAALDMVNVAFVKRNKGLAPTDGRRIGERDYSLKIPNLSNIARIAQANKPSPTKHEIQPC